MNEFKTLLKIAQRKSVFDETNAWFDGAQTYLQAIKKETDEVIEELPKDRACYLEDELADVLWNYLNSLLALEKEAGISTESVLRRACEKYEERIAGIESGELWKEVKARQKQALKAEFKQANSNTQP